MLRVSTPYHLLYNQAANLGHSMEVGHLWLKSSLMQEAQSVLIRGPGKPFYHGQLTARSQ